VIRHLGGHGYEADVTALERHLQHYGLGGATGVVDVLKIRREKWAMES